MEWAALLVMRTYALYDRSPRILVGLLSLVAIGGGVGLVSDHDDDVFVVMMGELIILMKWAIITTPASKSDVSSLLFPGCDTSLTSEQ